MPYTRCYYAFPNDNGGETGVSTVSTSIWTFLDKVFSYVAQIIPPIQKGNALYIANLIVHLVLYADDLAIFVPNAPALQHIFSAVDLFY